MKKQLHARLSCSFLLIGWMGLSGTLHTQAAAPPPHVDDLEIQLLSSGIREGMEMTIANDGRVFIAERPGKVKLFSPNQPGELTEVLDLSSDTRGESGLLGICLDPGFDRNQWIWIYHTVPIENDERYHAHHLGRFTFKGQKIDPDSEHVFLKVKAAYQPKRIHEAGSIAFDQDGLLYLSCGDNQIRSEYLFSCKTSANSNDLRGKILRIRPMADGSYEIPEGNLFPPGTPNTRPEIYIMGLRNPFRISVDLPTGWLLWGENGPPNNWVPGTTLDKSKVPLGYDEYNLAQGPGFHGYPMIIANQQPYLNYDFETKKPRGYFDPAKPINDHPENSGVQELPPSQPPLIWYQGEQAEFPELGNGGESAIAGPIFRPQKTQPKQLRLPQRYEDQWIIGEYARGWVKSLGLDDHGKLTGIHPLLPPLRYGKPSNLKIGPQGRLHVLYYAKNETGALVRVENKEQVAGSTAIQLHLANDKPPKGISKKDPGLKLMAQSDCLSCHQWKRTVIAPPYMEIAKKYKGDEGAAKLLAEKVIQGGVGVWGEIPMPPHPQHSRKEVDQMIMTILKLNTLK